MSFLIDNCVNYFPPPPPPTFRCIIVIPVPSITTGDLVFRNSDHPPETCEKQKYPDVVKKQNKFKR